MILIKLINKVTSFFSFLTISAKNMSRNEEKGTFYSESSYQTPNYRQRKGKTIDAEIITILVLFAAICSEHSNTSISSTFVNISKMSVLNNSPTRTLLTHGSRCSAPISLSQKPISH